MTDAAKALSLSSDALRDLFLRCADEALYPWDSRNLNVDEKGRRGPRGGDWVHRIVKRITYGAASDGRADGAPACILFSGMSGSGKSTELLRAAEELKKGRFLPVRMDTSQRLDLRAPLDITDLMLVMLYEAERVVSAQEGGAGRDRGGSGGEFDRVFEWFRGADPARLNFPFGVEGRALWENVVGEFREDTPLRKRMRAIMKESPTAFLEQISRGLESLDRRVRDIPAGAERSWRGLVLIVDSLDRLRGTGVNDRLVLASADEIFTNPIIHLPVHVIYTVPPSVTLRLTDPNVVLLPMIKLHPMNRPGEVDAAGYEALRDILRRRIDDAHLHALFGDDAEAAAQRIILASGGYPRALVRLLQQVILEARADDPSPMVSLEALEDVIVTAAQPLQSAVRTRGEGAIQLLRRVVADNNFIADDTQRGLVASLLNENILLHYKNGKWWYDVHPWVREMPELKP